MHRSRDNATHARAAQFDGIAQAARRTSLPNPPHQHAIDAAPQDN